MESALPPHTISIADSATGARAKVLVSLGFNCFSWQLLSDGPRELLWSHPDFANGNERPSGSGIPLLFPFPGRIAGGQFSFGDKEYVLEPGDAFGNAIHGFVYNRPWRVVEQSESQIVGEFQASVDDPNILRHWPADFRIRVGYGVDGRRLTCDVQYANPSDSPLPCGFGTHAYFRLPLAEGAKSDDTIVTIPVRQQWELRDMIPTGNQTNVRPELSTPEGFRLAEHQFDTVFTGLQADAQGSVRTQLADRQAGRKLIQSFEDCFTQCVVYTPPHREAICLEPYTCVPDAVNLIGRGCETGLQVLKRGEDFSTTLVLEVEQ